jgi:anti-anti-sigma regulatory factor
VVGEVDLAGVTLLDRAGISALVAVRNAAIEARRQMRVSHPQPIMRRLLEVSGLLGVLIAPIDQPQPLLTPIRTPITDRVCPRD